MKRSLGLVAALVLSASLATASAGSADAAPAKVLSKTQLRHALLTVKDLPQNFTVEPGASMSSSSNDDGTIFAGDPACATWFRMADPVLNDPSAPKAVRAFMHSSDFDTVQTGMQSFSSPAQARRYFADLTSTISSCHHATAHDPKDDTTVRLTVKHHDSQVRGRRALVATLHAHIQGLTANTAVTAARVGNNIVSVDATAFGKSASAEARLAKNLLRAQTTKLIQHLR